MKRPKNRDPLLYENKYGSIPIDYRERLEYMYDLYQPSEKKCDEIINKRNVLMNNLFYRYIRLVLFQEPVGTPRARHRIIHKRNFHNEAISNPSFVHVYSPYAKENNVYMKRMVESELKELESLICTPIIIQYRTFFPIGNSSSIEDKFLLEIGLYLPLIKPDWDNIGKTYCDMSNLNIWLDDDLVVKGTVEKYRSILPRVEIDIWYLNTLYNKSYYNTISNRKDYIRYGCNVDYFGKEG